MREGIVLFLLIIFGIEDVRKKSLSLPLLVAAFGLMVFSRFLFGNLAEGAAGVGSGILVWLIGRISRGQIGSGDGFLLMITGGLLGFWKNMELFLTALFFCAFYSAGVLILQRKGWGHRVPFVPFLAGAQLFRILVLLG